MPRRDDYPLPPPRPHYTHYVDWDAPGFRWVRAVCNALMSRDQHTNDPTCPHCQDVLAFRARMEQAGPPC